MPGDNKIHGPAQAQQLEFVAKKVNDLLAKQFPKTRRKLGFMTFVFDMEATDDEQQYIGYLSSARRVDAFRMVLEWLERTTGQFTRKEFIEVLREFEKEVDDEAD